MQTIWQNVKDGYRAFEKDRFEIIQLSQGIGRESKRMIHNILHGKVSDGKPGILEIKHRVDELLKKIIEKPHLYAVGAIVAGLEEYAELVFLEAYRKKGFEIKSFIADDFHHEAVIGGIADASGELVRLVRSNMDIKEAGDVHEYILGLYEHFLDLEVSRNNKLRSKIEDVRRNMLKLEEIIFNLKLKEV